jgi:hypothetical protein
MSQRRLDGAPAFFQNVKRAFDAFTDAVQPLVKGGWILDELVCALGGPAISARLRPRSLPLGADEAFVRPHLATGREAVQDFSGRLPFIGVGREAFKGLRRTVPGG